MLPRRPVRVSVLCLFVVSLLVLANTSFKSSAQIASKAARPAEVDVRGQDGLPRGTALRSPTPVQLKALASLQGEVGAPVQARYNGLTATPYHLLSHTAYLSKPSSASPESIARNFLAHWREIFRFNDNDLNNLKLKSRAYVPDTGTTIMLFGQQVSGLPVDHGDVLVNVNRAGQIINVGGFSYPRMTVTNTAVLTPAQAIATAAADMGVTAFTPQQLGTSQVITTFGNLPSEYVDAPRFGGGGVFSDDILVIRTIFPMGDQARVAYKFTLVTPQYEGIMWENIVDAQTGSVLRRASLTSSYGPRGGGQGAGRLGTFRPDVQDKVEAFNQAGSASGKVFDAMPAVLSGRLGFGRSPSPGTSPTYASESATSANAGRGFKFSQASARIESPLIFSAPFGQVLRGFPDANNPSTESRFGWFYLPTDPGGAEITSPNAIRAGTRDFGYAMATEAQDRNLDANSPVADKSQPFSATLTPLSSAVTLKDGRVLSSVFQSNYTEGNNVLVADDHQNDNETTHGIKGFSLSRQFIAAYYDFINGYEYGGVNAGTTAGVSRFPATTFADVYPGTLTLFYFNNILHDYLYSVGFTESLWNFQQDNFGAGGAGQDAVSAQVQDGSGINNANFGTPSDGGRPRMQMFLFTEGTFRRTDGDFDFDVVAHEFYHGVSNRSVGKGISGALGGTESGGQGEGWSDYNADSITDDDGAGEYATGEFDVAIRRLPATNYAYSYGAVLGAVLKMRDGSTPEIVAGATPEVHDIGELWAAILWDMRELLIMKDPNAVFFDGIRRLGGGASFFIGNRQVNSVDGNHPIDYRASFNTTDPATIIASQHIVRPGLVASEIAGRGDRSGPLCSAITKGARLSDTLVLRGMQLSPANPSFVDSRDAILLADRELTGGENQALIWRAFASHGVGAGADSTGSGNANAQNAPVVIEDFAPPSTVSDCEKLGPLAAPSFTVRNLIKNTVTITINDGVPVRDAASYVIARATNAGGPFIKFAEIAASDITFRDNNGGAGLDVGKTYYYQVHATRNPECVSTSNIRSVAVTVGDVITPAPEFAGVDKVTDPAQCNRLVLGWNAAISGNASANIVYDVYRVSSVPNGDGTQDPSFLPSSSNRVASGVTGTSYTDTGLALGRVYYYIVQARDLNNGKKDTNNTGNTVTKFNGPTSAATTPVFALENFENASANGRFTPQLVDSASDPNEAAPAFQRVTNVDPGNGVRTSMMYAPDFSPSEGTPDPAGFQHGGPSDFSTIIGPLSLTSTSLMEFDHFFSAEANFDGGVIEIALGAPIFKATPFPDNVTTFDVGNYIIQGGYNGKFDGTFEAVMTPILQGRRGYTGNGGLQHVRVVLGSFAAGGANNASGLPVYLRFRMTSDFATSYGINAGWYVDNLVISNMSSLGCPSGLAKLEDNSSDSGSTCLATLSRSSEVCLMNPNTPVWAVVGGRSGWEFGGAARCWRPRNQGRPQTAARTELAHSSLFQLSLNRAKVTC